MVAFRFVEALGERLTSVESKLEEIAFKSIPARLASLLLRLADDEGDGTEVVGYTHQALGEILGTYRETVTQTLNDFKAEGLVDISRKRVQIVDYEEGDEEEG